MNVTFYNRPKMAGAHSVEEVFTIIKNELRDEINITNFHCSSRWGRTHSLLNAHKYQGDVNHITGDVNHLAITLSSRKTILTLHDMRHYEQDLKGVKKNLFGTFKLGLPFRRVTKITTVSAFMKQRIVDEFSIAPAKIEVIHNPAPPDFMFHEKEFNTENPWILQIGSAPHKNLSRLMKAIGGLNFRLLLIRKKDAAIKKELEEKGIEYRWTENIPRQKIYEWYKECDIVFFASEFEGFGVPVLEAQAVGRPVITSNVASMPEVAGEGAHIVNPYKVQEIRQALMDIKSNKTLRDDLVEKGRENLKRFSASAIAGQYLNLYKRVADGS